MSVHRTAAAKPGMHLARKNGPLSRADVAYRRAWWSLALYPITFVLAFVIGEGLLSVLAEDVAEPAFWEALAAATPALLVFASPGVLAVVFGRRAMRWGRRDGKVPAVVGAAIGLGFAALNGLAFVVGALAG